MNKSAMRRLGFLLLAGWLLTPVRAQGAEGGPLAGASPEEVPKDQQQRIWKAAPDKPRVAPKVPRKVLVFMTPAQFMKGDPHKGYCLPYAACAMKALGEKTKAYEPVISNDQSLLHPADLKAFDAIVLSSTCGKWTTPSEEALEAIRKRSGDQSLTAQAAEQLLRKGFLDFVAEGKGLLACHYANGGHRDWPEYYDLLGAKSCGHPWNEEIGIKVDEPDHPLVAAFEGKDFRLADEIFIYTDPYTRSKLRVLLHVDTEKTNMVTKEPLVRKDNDFALAWVKNHGKGRVLYTSFGHRTELYWNPKVMQFYLDAVQFAVGDLEAPAAPKGAK